MRVAELTVFAQSVGARVLAYGPALLALVMAGGGSRAVRGRPRWVAPLGAVAAGVGWAAIDGSWRWIARPRTGVEWLLLPAAVLALARAAEVWRPSRWWTVAAIGFGAWWLASSPAGRAEFWRVEIGMVAASYVLTRAGASAPLRGLAVAVTLWLGLVLGHAPAVWELVALVLASVCVGVMAGGRGGVVPPGLLMLGVAGVELGAGRAARGGLTVVDLACAGALLAPLGAPFAERRLRSFGRGAALAAALATACLIAGAAWMAARVLRA